MPTQKCPNTMLKWLPIIHVMFIGIALTLKGKNTQNKHGPGHLIWSTNGKLKAEAQKRPELCCLAAGCRSAQSKASVASPGWKSERRGRQQEATLQTATGAKGIAWSNKSEEWRGRTHFIPNAYRCVESVTSARLLELSGISQEQCGLIRLRGSRYYFKWTPLLLENISHWQEDKNQPSNTNTEKWESFCVLSQPSLAVLLPMCNNDSLHPPRRWYKERKHTPELQQKEPHSAKISLCNQGRHFWYNWNTVPCS